MKKRKILIHIGLHKTGSSAIQLALQNNREFLKSHGLLYPESGCYYYWGQHNLAWQLISHPMYEADESNWDDFFQEVSDSSIDQVVVSSEVFSTYSVKDINALKELLQGFDVDIVLYLRGQVEWLQSFWCEMAKGRQGVADIPELDAWVLNALPRSNSGPASSTGRKLGNYLELIRNWESVFSPESIHVRSFEESIKGDLVRDFLVGLGVENFDTIELPDRVNDKVDIKKLNLIRVLRSKLRARGFDDVHVEKVKEVIMFSDFIVNEDQGIYLKEDTVGTIVDRYKSVNRELIDEYFDGKPVLPIEMPKYNFAKIEDYSLEEVSLLISGLMSSDLFEENDAEE